jgi:hypothetical protein
MNLNVGQDSQDLENDNHGVDLGAIKMAIELIPDMLRVLGLSQIKMLQLFFHLAKYHYNNLRKIIRHYLRMYPLLDNFNNA